MKTCFLWINTLSPSPYSSPLLHTEEIMDCLPAFPTSLNVQMAARTVVGYVMLLKWIQDCVKSIFPSLEKLFWVFLLKAASNFQSTH